MEILWAILLGIIEGVTEFLPISSTGHLLLTQDLIGYKDTAEIFTVVIQLGALGAVVWYFRQDLILKVEGLFKKDKKTQNFWKIWIVATLPATLIGLLLEAHITTFNTTPVIAGALIIGGILIWLIETYHKPNAPSSKIQLSNISMKQALSIGFYQALALIPGVSRSGSTIMGGLLSGLDRVTATAFSFYLSIPILFLAGVYKLATGFNNFDSISGGGTALLAGTVASFISAFIVIGWLLKYVSRHNFKIFAYYRIILGIILLICINFI